MRHNILRIRNILFTFGAYSLLALSFSGTLIGTYAWYSYEARARSIFNGTTVNNQGALRVGLFSDVDLPDAREYGLTKDTRNPNIYWGEDGLESTQLNYFLSTFGYATSIIRPVSSGAREVGDDLVLHPCPSKLNNSYIREIAERERYVYLPLVFQIVGEESSAYLYFKDTNVRSNGKIGDSLRIYSSSELTKFLFAADLKDDGYDKVGGTLNLDDDVYYDFDHGKEFVYGEYDSLVYKNEVTEDEVDVENPTTFNAIHKKGIYAVDEERSEAKKS